MKKLRSTLLLVTGFITGFAFVLGWTTFTHNSARTEDPFLHRVGKGEDTTANSINTSTRILCWIMTRPENLNSRTRHTRTTWAHRCDTTLYMSSSETGFPTVGLNVSEGRENLFWKTIRAFQYIHENHLDQAEWFLKADDDTFVVVENLRFLVSTLSPEEPWYMGRRFSPFLKEGYNSGGAGYVLSKEALRRFIRGFETGTCTHFSNLEDIAVGKCMEDMGVLPSDTRDVLGRQTFNAFPPDHVVIKRTPRPRPWYLIYDFYPIFEGPRCCSDYTVSFHYIHGVQLYIMQYFAYHLRPYGYKYRFNPRHFQDNTTVRAT